MKSVLFIDRDGTLLEEVNFLSRVEDMRIFPYTGEALSLLKENGFLIVVVTNQSGIGRGIYTEDDMHTIHQEMSVSLPELIDTFHFCPHLPDEGCSCRKPKTGMIESATQKFAIDLEKSWLHARASNTEPIIRLIAEAPTTQEAQPLLDEANA